MQVDIGLLALTGVSIGFIHTLLGPDHYLPFVAMSAARGWSRSRTLWVTALCGLGHVLGSVVIGLAGILIGTSLQHLQWFEGIRGGVAAWALTAFGFTYMAWGLKKAWRSKPHTHRHEHADGSFHLHEHGHEGAHVHVHLAPYTPSHLHSHPHPHPHPHSHDHGGLLPHAHVTPERARSITPWALFVIFVLGPCEPLIPLLMVPASRHSWWGLALVVLAFGAATIATMLSIVYLASRGLERLPLDSAERYSHALAGAALGLCGLGIVFLGL
jgi:nickel/cobalt transporter (NicO) family protein